MKKYSSQEELKSEMYNYMIADNKLFDNCCKSLKIQSVVSEDPMFLKKGTEPKRYAFIGVGCGITWLKFPKLGNAAKMFEEVYRSVLSDVRDWLLSKFTEEEKNYYISIGCPLTAIFYQDQGIQIALYSRAAKFATDVIGIKNVSVESRLD